MDAVKFIEERNRMCDAHSPGCEGCPIDEAKPVISECVLWTFVNPGKAAQIVEKWSAAHPRKTRQSVFLEQWPNAKVDANGVLEICPVKLDTNQDCLLGQCTHMSCADCCDRFWKKVVE